MKHLKNFNIFEAVASTDNEYFDAVALHYDEELIDMIKQGEQMAFRMTGSRKAITEKTDGGNLLIRYCEGNNLLLILGAVTKTGKMNRQDIQDMNNWLNYAIEQLSEGIVIMTSPNELSEPLVKKLITLAERKGLELDVQSQDIDVFSDDGVTWKHYIIQLVN